MLEHDGNVADHLRHGFDAQWNDDAHHVLHVLLTGEADGYYADYAERRISALIQDRLGPNRVGPDGLFQPIADAAKFLLKEDFTPGHVNTFYYWLAPCLAMIPAITTLAVVPFGSTS